MNNTVIHTWKPAIESLRTRGILRTYDSDFSTASTPPGSPSSSSSGLSDSRPASPVDPDIVALIPSEFYVPPQVSATFQWACPVQECGYLIDLLHLTEENLATEDLTEDEKRRLKSKSWNIREDWVREAFGYMVDKHLVQHLDEWGIRLEMQGKRVRIRVYLRYLGQNTHCVL